MSKKKVSGNGIFAGLRSDQKKAVKLVFGGTLANGEIAKKMTNKDIAKTVGCGESTVRRWRGLPKFQDALFKYSLSQLKEAVPLAVSTLMYLMVNAKSEMVRLQIAKMILDMEGTADTPQAKALTKKAQAEAIKAETEAKLAKQQINDHDTASGQVMRALQKMPPEELIKMARKLAGEQNAKR